MTDRSGNVRRLRTVRGAARPETATGDTLEMVRRTVAEYGGEGRPSPETAHGPAPGPKRLRGSTQHAQRPVRKDGHGQVIRPERAALVLAAVALIFFLPPWALPALVVILGLALIAIYASLGYDRIAELAVAHYRYLERNDPGRADELRQRAARTAERLNRWSAYLPASWTQGLYIPDFEPAPEPPAKMREEPFERLTIDMRA